MQSFYKEITGGVRAGIYNVTFPFAKLRVSSNELQILAPGLDNIQLNSNQVIGFAEYGSLLGKGYIIYHNVRAYPTPLIFWANPDKIDQIIKEAGFVCCGIGTIDTSQEASSKAISLVFFFLILSIIMIGLFIGLISH